MTRKFASQSIAVLLALCSCADEPGSKPVRAEQLAAGSVRSEYAMIDLGLGSARGLNDRGQVIVVRSERDTGVVHSYVWTENEGLIEIETQGQSSLQAVAINNAGLVVGTANGSQHAFAWTPQRGGIDCGTLGGRWSSAAAVNNHGEVVGASATAAGETHAFIWTEQNGMIDLGTVGTASEAAAINESGRTVGLNAPGAFSWTRQTGMTPLGSLPNVGPSYTAVGVNDSGAVIGMAEGSQYEHAFLWTKEDGMLDLGTLGGATSIAFDINNRGEVVGGSSTAPPGPNLQVHAFIWTRKEGMTDLGTLGGSRSQALAINDAGDVVGYSLTADSINHAFLWTRQRGMVDLGRDGEGSIAYWINQRGQIAGDTFDFFDPTMPAHAVLWER